MTHTYKGGEEPQVGDIVEFVYGGEHLTGEVAAVGDWSSTSGERVQIAVDTTVDLPAGLARLVAARPEIAPEPTETQEKAAGQPAEAAPAASKPSTTRKPAQRGQKGKS